MALEAFMGADPFKLHDRGFLSLSSKIFCLKFNYFPQGVESPSSLQGLFEGMFVLWVASIRGFDP